MFGTLSFVRLVYSS